MTEAATPAPADTGSADPGPAVGAVTSRRTLETQRDQWLRSLDQLDAELAAGDLSTDDHRQLSERYSAQLATVLRRIDGHAAARDEAAGTAASTQDGSRRFSRLALLAGLAVFAVGAGFLLAQTSGERGVNDQLSGEIDVSGRSRVAECQELGSIGADLVGALACFDELLLDDPENAEALSYRGWYLLLAAGALQASADTEEEATEAEELIASGLTYLDQAIEIDPLLPDPLAFRATVYDRQGQAEEACADVATLLELDPPAFFVEQTTGIVARNGC
ncbi:MAG: hypothetical protein AAF962_00165 [Actinomycetota bacterium]